MVLPLLDLSTTTRHISSLSFSSFSNLSLSSCSFLVLLSRLTAVSAARGRKMAPHTMVLSMMAEMMRRVPRHWYLSSSNSVKGAKMVVPMPEPATAMPVRSGRMVKELGLGGVRGWCRSYAWVG